MKKLQFFSVLVLLSILFMGCPYSADVPIDQPTVKIDDKLLGKWESKSSSESTVNVTKLDANTYKIEQKTSSTATPEVYSGYLSDVNGTKFLNVWSDGNSEKKYYLYKVELNNSATKVTLLPVTDNIEEKFTTSQELKDFIKKYMGLSFFFSKDKEVYIKAD